MDILFNAMVTHLKKTKLTHFHQYFMYFKGIKNPLEKFTFNALKLNIKITMFTNCNFTIIMNDENIKFQL